MDKKALTLGFKLLGRMGSEWGYSSVAAITLARASKSVFLWVVTICIRCKLYRTDDKKKGKRMILPVSQANVC
jgi:hypothetical protein